MTSPWQDVRCASIPEGALSVLADLRREPGIRVTIVRGRAWVCWEDGPVSEETRRILVERLLPLAGVEVFSWRDGHWHRPGERLPAFDVPIGDGSGGIHLDRAILPEPLPILQPQREPPRPMRLRLVRDDRGAARPARAARCRLGQLVDWAEHAPSDWIESLSGAWCVHAEGDPGAAEVLVLGPDDGRARPESSAAGWGRLPAFGGGLRYWGDTVLIPLGYRSEPVLVERALRDAVGAGPEELVVLDQTGPELIPHRAFRPLSRASIRLAGTARSSGPAIGGGPP
jgi:MoxR-vWA-beta-propeller ternary system domain bpX2